MRKTGEEYFCDWHGHLFGFGYGSGESHTLPALQKFLELCPDKSCYDYRTLEAELTPPVAWLLINMLCADHMLEYGTSPRYAWLTGKGRALKSFVVGRPMDELLAIVSPDENYTFCYPDACNCEGYVAGRICENPFFNERFSIPEVQHG